MARRTLVASSLIVLLGVGGSVAGATAAAKTRPVCELLTTENLTAAFNTPLGAGRQDTIGFGHTCSYDGAENGPISLVTVRVAIGKEAKADFHATVKALRDTQRGLSNPATLQKVRGLGDQAYYVFDTFIREGNLVLRKGNTYLQVTASLHPTGEDAVASQPTLTTLARAALARRTS
jgi:hypothetical protein